MIRTDSMRTAATAGLLLAAVLLPRAPAQDWTDEQLMAAVSGFLQDPLVPRLEQMASLLANRSRAAQAMAARVHGDHREYLLKIERLIADLSNDRWPVREQAERTLVEVGARARTMIEQRAEKSEPLEEGIRCRRILQALTERGTEQEQREIAILRGLVMTIGHMPPEERFLRALISALGHTDQLVVDAAIRALGTLGDDDEATAVRMMLDQKGGMYRNATLGAVSRMKGTVALQTCAGWIASDVLNRTELMAMVRNLRLRSDAADLLASLTRHKDLVVARAAALTMPPVTGEPALARLMLADRSPLEVGFAGFLGDGVAVANPVPGLDRALLPFAECEIIDFAEHQVAEIRGVRLFVNQGSLVTGELQSIDPESVRLLSPVFGSIVLPRDRVQGIAIDPDVDRLVGASHQYDRVRTKANQFIDGQVIRADGRTATVSTADGEKVLPMAEVAGILLLRPRLTEVDATIYSRVDLTNGDRLIGFLVGSTASHLAISVVDLGAVVLPIQQIAHIELGVGGGAMWGFTLIADYSENKIIEVDDQGREVFELKDVFGAWDAECLDNGNLLITEFSVSRVRELTRKGDLVWEFEDLKNPYDADRLPNGNTLIADTFNGRVVEVSPSGGIVWQFDKEIRPFDVDRLPNGNTLIADVLKDRVIEVSPEGEVVWEVKGMNNVHDADRLPNGNTLITLRSKGSVIEVDVDGRVVWQLDNLSSPSDADRLPNGNTIVAENNQVREFDRRRNLVWKKEMTWAVEVNRY